jgi:hypothetical protein
MPNEEQSSPAGTPDPKVKAVSQKQLIEELKNQWSLLWKERFDDKVKAEGISVKNYEGLFVEQGTVIHATRDYKALNFRDVLDKNLVENPDRYVAPSVHVGGWNKFIKTQIRTQAVDGEKDSARAASKGKVAKGQAKKGGRGWLHST